MEIENANLQDYIALFRRRRSVMFVAFSTVAIVVVLGTLLMKDQYRSTATIAIERPEIPENMVRTTFTYFDTDLRVDRIRDRVLSTTNIEAWISENDLYHDILNDGTMSAAVSQFRKDVEVITIQAREDIAVKKQGETIAFDVSYYGETPAKAVKVASELADTFLEENRASRSASVQETVAFFQRDADRLSRTIEQAEQELANFKERYSGALPSTALATSQTLDRYERELGDVERDIRDLREQKRILQTDLSKESRTAPIFSETGETILAGPDRLRMLQQQLVELSAKYGSGHPDVVRTRREIELLSGDSSLDANSLRQELEVARRDLMAARQRYSADHPDVVSLARKVQNLENQLSALERGPQGSLQQTPDNPAYIAIQIQIEAADAELAALGSRARELRSRIGQYQDRVLQAPQVEREYLALQRKYDQAIQDYNEVREKQTEAQQALDLETSEKGERYVLQNTPEEPIAPAFPNRLAIIILGMIFAIATSFGAVLVAEALDSRVRGVRDLRILTGMPPIAVIPVLETRAIRKKRFYAWATSVFGVSAFLILMIAMQI